MLDAKFLRSIDPKQPGGGKFSPNLHRWIKRRRRGVHADIVVCRGACPMTGKKNTLLIGAFDGPDWFHGCTLNGVLCNGGREQIYAYRRIKLAPLREFKSFWDRYQKIGRCAIDPKHEAHFIEQDDPHEKRWAIHPDDHLIRVCQWCGDHTQRRVFRLTETRRYTCAIGRDGEPTGEPYNKSSRTEREEIWEN